MRRVVIVSNPSGPRVYVFRVRVHHGATGCALGLLGIWRRSWLMGIMGLLVALHDRRDSRVWFRMEKLG